MAEISKITALDGTTYDIKDTYAREGIPFGIVDSTSTSTAFTATVPGITEYRDGTCVLLKNGKVTSAENFTIDINGLGAKPSYNNMAAATRDTTIFNVNYTMLFVYDSTRVSGGAWICYRGYNSNDNTIGYQLRTNSSNRAMADVTYRYRIFFESADGTLWVPANKSTSTNATASRAVNQRAINPFGEIVYYGTTTSISAGSTPSNTVLWQQYTLTLGYSFNRTGAALVLSYPKPIYIKCAPQADGSAIIDADTPYVTALPTSNDGKIYIYLGRTYSATAVEMVMYHPVYYHDGTGIRLWTGKTIPSKVSELSNDLNFVDAAGASAAAPVKSVNGQTGAVSIAIPSKGSDVGLGNVDNVKQYSASNPPPYPVTSVNGSTGAVTIAIPSKASDVGALPSNTTYVSTVNGTSGAVTIHGLPSGGTNGQSLVKTSSSDYAVAWATVSGGGGIAENGLPAGGTVGQLLKKNSSTNYDATWATISAADVGAFGIFNNGGDVAATVKVFTKDGNGDFYWATASATPKEYHIPKYDSGGYLKSNTPTSTDNSTKVATTAFVKTAIPSNISSFTNDSGFVNASGAAAAAPVQSVNGQTGTVSIAIPSTAADVGALSTSTTYVSTVNGSSGAVTLSIPSISVSQDLSSGTKIGTITIDGATTSLYAPTDTDTKVTQTATASSGYTYWRPLIIGDSSASAETGAFATSTNAVRTFDILRVQPSTGTIKALNFKGNLTGTASGNLTSSSTLNPAKLSGVNSATTSFLREDGTWATPAYPSVPSVATAVPANLGTAAVGSSTKYATEDHVHNYPDIVYVGSSAPTDTNIQLWLDTSAGGVWQGGSY